ncbi:multiple epidermal growth factor-like domains protein 10 [Ruditapes philippinarum]|uniref:multiple epidermal growth factor-like domains protein 10 n=1 Tax=Ruditapes philippinarum TaxID=129788 RepID=UPI00295B502A|nr:multiple epidermal growth factor-like domains protein 10 [Ruditapes philippinarum]
MANIRCDFFLFLCLCSKGYTYNESTLVCDDGTGTASTSTVTYSSGCVTQTDNVATTVAATQTDNVERTYAASTDTGTTVGYGEQCSATSDCVAHSSCTRGTCSCNAGYRTNGTMCQKIIGGPCVYTSQCTYYEPNSNCIIGLCTCLDGYYETEVLCSKGAQAQTFSLLVVVAHVLLVAMGT